MRVCVTSEGELWKWNMRGTRNSQQCSRSTRGVSARTRCLRSPPLAITSSLSYQIHTYRPQTGRHAPVASVPVQSPMVVVALDPGPNSNTPRRGTGGGISPWHTHAQAARAAAHTARRGGDISVKFRRTPQDVLGRLARRLDQTMFEATHSVSLRTSHTREVEARNHFRFISRVASTQHRSLACNHIGDEFSGQPISHSETKRKRHARTQGRQTHTHESRGETHCVTHTQVGRQ